MAAGGQVDDLQRVLSDRSEALLPHDDPVPRERAWVVGELGTAPCTPSPSPRRCARRAEPRHRGIARSSAAGSADRGNTTPAKTSPKQGAQPKPQSPSAPAAGVVRFGAKTCDNNNSIINVASSEIT